MAPQRALVALLCFVLAANAQISSYRSTSAFWTYTSRYAAVVSPSPYTSRNGQVSTYSVTDNYRTVKSTVTPTATPTSTSTSWSYYSDVEIVYHYYGQNAVALSDVEPEYGDEGYSTAIYGSYTSGATPTTTYFMPVTMTAPAFCPTQFTVTTTASISIPSIVRDQVKPTSTVNAGITTRGSYYTYSVQTWYLSAGAAPFISTDDFTYSYYIASCSTPPAARSSSSGYDGGGGSSSDDDSSSSDSYYCSRYSYSYYCSSGLKTWIIVIASLIPGLFLLGFLESWFWFRRLMTGQSAMRFGTVCWVLISLWVLCFTRMQDTRSKEDQKLLQEKWKHMRSGAAFKAWWKWGFRHAYPVEHLGQFSKQTVGVVPIDQSIHPAMAQTPQGFMPGPPLPGAPGQNYYYAPPPPGWVPTPGWVLTPDGQGFMPPQGYMYPPPQQAGYYGGDLSKGAANVSTSPVSQHPGMVQQPYAQPASPTSTSPAQPQVQQPVHHANDGSAPCPLPQGPVPETPVAQRTSTVSEVPANTAPRSANALQAPMPRKDTNDRSLYE